MGASLAVFILVFTFATALYRAVAAPHPYWIFAILSATAAGAFFLIHNA